MLNVEQALKISRDTYKGELLSQVFEDGSMRFYFVKMDSKSRVVRVCTDSPIPALEIESENPDHVCYVGHSLKYYLEGETLYELQDTFFEDEYKPVEINYTA